ncbi:hypothetical protein ACGFYQ_40020 [Streptomyces sp. NPDC048258]|uniref:hypothetical protein n=1 Tax=Streptomyces sp. NPDC048258 TaxID=3365527 RepID=UPI0037231937
MLKDGAEAVCVSVFEGLEVEWDVIVGPASDAHGRPVQWDENRCRHSGCTPRPLAQQRVEGFLDTELSPSADREFAVVVVPVSSS